MKKPVFTGAGVAIITPFKSTGEVNYEEFGRIIDYQIAHHTDAIIVCGTTGEASALHDKEHREVLSWCCEYVNHRVPVIAGTGLQLNAALMPVCRLRRTITRLRSAA